MLCKEMVIHVVLALTIACAPHGEKCWQKITVPRWAGLDLSLGTCSFSGLWPPGLWTGWTWTSAPSTPGCPEAKGAFCLEAAGLSRSLGAMEKLPCGSQVLGGCDLHADEGVLAVGASLSCPREPGLSPGKVPFQGCLRASAVWSGVWRRL